MLSHTAGAIARVAAMTCTTFETLPFNGLIVLVVAICHTTHRKAYGPVFMQSVVIPLICSFLAALWFIAAPGLG
jgi:H+/gluconate symporter-like permease